MKIKRCPHCGGGGFLERNYSYRSRSWFIYVKYEICGAQGKIYNSPQEPDETSPAAQSAIVAWNMRTKEEVDT